MRTRFHVAACLALALGCGDDSGGAASDGSAGSRGTTAAVTESSSTTSGEGNTSTSVAAPTIGATSESTGGTSGEPSPCTESHPGDLLLDGQADVDALASLREVEGTLTITGDITNLDALGCLETIRGHLYVQETQGLQDLTGLGRLAQIGGQLHATLNPDLHSLEGLTSLRFIQVLRLSQNGITDLNLAHLQAAGEIVIGTWCGGVDEGEPLLQDFDGLESLIALERVTIYHAPSLTALSGLTAYAERGGSPPGLGLWFNDQLSPAVIAEVADAFSEEVYVTACENGGETDNPCFCSPPS